MRTIRNLVICVVGSAVWPAFLGLAAYAARQAPWPRSVAYPASAALAVFALSALAVNLLHWLFGPGGWAEDVLGMPAQVARSIRRAGLGLVAAHAVVMLPVWLITNGLLAPGGRPISAPSVARVLILVFELAVLAAATYVLHSRSALVVWLSDVPQAGLMKFVRHRRLATRAVLGGIVGIIALDALGYCYSARRFSLGVIGSMAVALVCWGVYRILARLIDDRAWKWIKVGHGLKHRAEQAGDATMPDDLAGRLRRLSGYFAAGIWALGTMWLWGVDLALFRSLGDQTFWTVYGGRAPDGQPIISFVITYGDVTKALVAFALTAVAWRNLSTFFAVAVFPRIPDDPGIRYAALTLCRYAVLGVGLLCGLSAVHLGIEKIGIVFAALGVGLGFGLQEIVSNFVCGIILLLERPIRVGDIVTVSGMNGKVDRINIRATTIINGDNQSIIVPNRAFITGDLVNWTLKDKVIRVSIKVRAAYGTDPDRVSELLLAIAREDPDVLRNPVPTALVEEMADAGLAYVLHVHVPDPSLSGRVRHRLVREIQHRFTDEGIPMPVPAQKIVIDPRDLAPFRASAAATDVYRVDPASTTPPGPTWPASVLSPHPHTRPTPAPLENCNRGVDE